MAGARTPGGHIGLSSGRIDPGTLARTRSPRPGPTGISGTPTFGSPTLRRHRRRGRPAAPTATTRTIAISLDVIQISATCIDIEAQLAVANEILADCAVQFYVADTYTADASRSSIQRTAEAYWRDEIDGHESLAVRLAREFASMVGRIKVFLVRSVGTLAAFSIPSSLDAGHGNLGLRAYLSDLSLPDTLAHELGHILLNDPDADSHAADPGNLMADGRTRTGRALTEDQRQRIHRNARALAGLP